MATSAEVADKDAEFELDDNIDLTFLCSMVSVEQLLPNFSSLTPLTVTACPEMGSCESR